MNGCLAKRFCNDGWLLEFGTVPKMNEWVENAYDLFRIVYTAVAGTYGPTSIEPTKHDVCPFIIFEDILIEDICITLLRDVFFE